MKKSEIYVPITSEKERLEVVEILQNAEQEISTHSNLLKKNHKGKLVFDDHWNMPSINYKINRTKITIPQLKELLQPKTADHLIEKFKKKMAKKGFKVDVVFEGDEQFLIAKDDLFLQGDTEKRLTKGKSYKIISGDLSKNKNIIIKNNWGQDHEFTFENIHIYFEL